MRSDFNILVRDWFAAGNHFMSHVSILRGRGFTLVECLVVMGVVGLLLALSLPALQRTREAARRAQCASNLHNIGVAVHNHIAQDGSLPRGHFFRRDGEGSWDFSDFSPHTRILQHLDQSALFNSVNFRLGGDVYYGRQENSTAERSRVSVFLCPSDPEAGAMLRNSYRANTGPEADPYGALRRPGFAFGSFTPVYQAIRPADFTDGMAQTVLFSERVVGDGTKSKYTPHRDLWYAAKFLPWTVPPADEMARLCGSLSDPAPRHHSEMGSTWLYSGNDRTFYNHVLTPNSLVPDCGHELLPEKYAVVTARSYHLGGVQVLLADGSSRFVGDSIDLPIWRALGTRSDGITVDSF